MLFSNTSRRHLGRGPGRRASLATAMAVLATVVVAFVAPATPAHAAAYRFWGYYQLADADWTFATEGPATTKPEDGDVEGWRFAVADTGDVRTPRDVLTFEDICGDTEEVDGQKRVGLVVDYGREADAEDGEQPPEPSAQCVVADQQASGSEVLATAGLQLREEGGLTCGLNDYPSQGCGGEVDEVSEEAAAADAPIVIPVAGEDGGSTDEAGEDDQSTDEAAGAEVTSEPDDPGRNETGADEETGLSVGLAVALIVLGVALITGIIMAVQRRRRD